MSVPADSLERLEAEVAEHKRLARHHRRQGARKAATLAQMRRDLAAMGIGVHVTGEAQEMRHGQRNDTHPA